ncbi:MAG: TlpA family protein disulfide reductase [Clostridiales bacterium]|nr:TlpA family protein disulfide reductase [Clostridiales bacterium]
MKHKSLLALLLAFALCLGLAACGKSGGEPSTTPEPSASAEPQDSFPTNPIGTSLGDGMADLSFTTFDGKTYSLYETLQEKKMVLINVWATWCGPCQAEFPYMDAAYQAYKDDIEIFALSCEEEDTDDVIAEFVNAIGMTFPVGRDTPGMANLFGIRAIPTSIVVDRFGTICFIESNSITSVETFQRLFDIFLADDYTESVILEDGIPAKRPDVDPENPADLASVLGEGLTYANPDNEYNWPMAIEDDHVVSTNAAQGSAVSSLNVELTAAAGDVFAVDYAVSSEAGYDFLTIYVNGELVKYASGERDWTTFAYECEKAGDYTVTLAYEKDEASDDGEDVARFKDARLLTGDAASALLSSLPVYPYAGETALTVTTPGAREVVINDPTGTLEGAFGDVRWYIIPGDTASFSATLAEGLDAECASFYSYYDDDAPVLSDCVAGDHYEFTTNGVDSYEATGAAYCYVELIPSIFDDPIDIYFFNDEANLNAFLARNFTEDDGTLAVTWKYADGAAPESTAVSEGVDVLEEGCSLYYLVFVDQNGDPVEGVMANVCDDSACTPMKSDANGVVAFAYPSFAYHIQVIKVPDGYEYDLTAETYISADGGVTEFVVTKA